MSLSQKHSGKVLVPWFDITEWKSVYNLIYNEDCINWPKALELLKIWKLRTPLLSSGVEGTLILLEALLVDPNLSPYEVANIFSTSLVRFLNLCAANSDKQGTFYKAAMKNELPSWLIGLRHDIAHSHNVPSQSMLELSLRFCLDWLRAKYWEIQADCMVDFVANRQQAEDPADAVYVYINLIMGGRELELDEELVQRFDSLVKNRSKKQLTTKELTEQIYESLRNLLKKYPQEVFQHISKLLIDNYIILSIESETTESDFKKIPQSLQEKWKPLLNIINEAELTLQLVNKLFDFTLSDNHSSNHRQVASLWIKEIYQAQINQEKNIESDNCLHFNITNNSLKNKTFINDVLENLTPYTPIFIKEVLEYNNAPEEFIEDSVNLISVFNSCKYRENEEILTVDSLNLPESSAREKNCVKVAQPVSRWTMIEDIGPYENLPLGVLPHQSRTRNPLLDL